MRSAALATVMSYLKKVLERLERAPEFMCSNAVAKILEIDVSAFNKMRARGSGPPFEKLPGLRPVYSRSDLIEWVKRGTTHIPGGTRREASASL